MGDRLGIPGAVGFLPPLSFSPRPPSQLLGPRSPSPSRGWGWGVGKGAGSGGWPGPRLPLQTGVASARPASPSAFGFQETGRPSLGSPSGAPLACLRPSRGGCSTTSPSPRPSPSPDLAGVRACSRAPPRGHTQIHLHRRCLHLVESYTFGGYMPASGTAE